MSILKFIKDVLKYYDDRKILNQDGLNLPDFLSSNLLYQTFIRYYLNTTVNQQLTRCVKIC